MNRFPHVSRLALSAAGLLLVAVTATAQTAQPAPAVPAAPAAAATRIHEADQAFITDGTKTVSTQHDAARIADSRTSDSQVKAFAQRVSADDEKIIQAMRAASPRGVDVPANDPDTAVLNSIKTLRGAEFDKAYIEQVALAGQQKAISAFQAEIASGRDTKLKEVARQSLPILQKHYADAQKLAERHHLASARRTASSPAVASPPLRRRDAHQASYATGYVASFAINRALTSGHSSSMMLKRTELRLRPSGMIRSCRTMPSCFAPSRRIAARDCSFSSSVVNCTRTHCSTSNA